MIVRRVLTAVLVVGVVATAAAPPASAQTKVRRSQIGEEPSVVDIRSIKVQNNVENFAVTIRVQDLRKRRTAATVSLELPGTARSTYTLSVTPVSRGRYAFGMLRDQVGDAGVAVRCDERRLTVRTGRRGFFRLVVPQRCLGADAGRQLTSVYTYDKQGLDGAGTSRTDAASATTRRG